MRGASQSPVEDRIADGTPVEQPLSLGELAGMSWRATRDALRTDEGIQAAGLLGGAATGAGVAIFIEGMPIRPTAGQQREALHGSHARDGSPPMVEATPLQVGTISGLTALGLVGAALYTVLRARHQQTS